LLARTRSTLGVLIERLVETALVILRGLEMNEDSASFAIAANGDVKAMAATHSIIPTECCGCLLTIGEESANDTESSTRRADRTNLELSRLIRITTYDWEAEESTATKTSKIEIGIRLIAKRRKEENFAICPIAVHPFSSPMDHSGRRSRVEDSVTRGVTQDHVITPARGRVIGNWHVRTAEQCREHSICNHAHASCNKCSEICTICSESLFGEHGCEL